MKRLHTAFLIIICLFTVGCNNDKMSNQYTLNGNAKGVYNGMRVYLKEFDPRGMQVVKDTAIVMNETFQFKGTLDHPTIEVLAVDGIEGNLIFMIEGSEIEIDIDKENLAKSKVSGSKAHLDFKAFTEFTNELRDSSNDAMQEYRKARTAKDSIKIDSLTTVLNNYREDFYNYPMEFADKNPNSYFSLHLINLNLNKPDINFKRLSEIFENLNRDIRKSSKGLTVHRKLDSINLAN